MRDTFAAGQRQLDERMYFLSDANYNVTAVVRRENGVWQVAERVLYDAYGRPRFFSLDWELNAGPDGPKMGWSARFGRRAQTAALRASDG